MCGFYDINPSKFGRVNNLITFANKYGKLTDVYNGIDITLNARLPHGALVQGGMNMGHEVTDLCDVIGKADLPAATIPASIGSSLVTSLSGLASPSANFCRIVPPFFLPDIKLSGSYPLPWWGLQMSATLQSVPGPMIVATYVASNAQIAPSLGRDLAAGVAGTATVQLVAPGTMYGDRLNQVDVRATKTVRVHGTGIKGIVDVYNVFNRSPALSLNTRYGPVWQQPFIILTGRFAKFGLQVDF
jgi:hypothetical protein